MMPRVILFLVGALLLAGCGRETPPPQPVVAAPGPTERAGREGPALPALDYPALQALREQWGVEIVRLARSAGGFALDLRYRVVEPGKAAALAQPAKPWYIETRDDGPKLFVLRSAKTGPLRQMTRAPRPGQILFSIFANPGELVKPGDRVTVVLGDFRAAGVPVH